MILSYHRLCAWNGARLMDRERPGWAGRVSPQRLFIESGLDCVLGQEFGSYGKGRRALRLSGLRASLCGFILLHPYASWDKLTVAWRAEIARRQPAPVTVPVPGRRMHGLAA